MPSITLPTMDLTAPDASAEGEAPSQARPRFEDAGILGQGGSAVVRRLFDTTLLRHVAVKSLTAADPGAQARFLTEAQITAQLEHPNIVPVHEHAITSDGQVYLSMKLVSGDTLGARIAELGERRLEPAHLSELLDVLERVCDALAYAHSRGVVHRDLKPSNIMVGAFGQVYLMDWGIAWLGGPADPPVRTSHHVQSSGAGTPSYMAPEQAARREEADPRVDVYALGGLLYAILTGHPPHRGRSVREILGRAKAGDITPPEELVTDGMVPRGLARIAMTALATAPEDRVPTVMAFKSELATFRRGSWRLPTREVPAGSPVVEEGERGEEAFVVVRGRCAVERSGEGVVDTIEPGDVFGEMAVLTGNPRDATVRAVTDVVVQVVSRDALANSLELDSWSGRFVQALARRVVALHEARRPTDPQDP